MESGTLIGDRSASPRRQTCVSATKIQTNLERLQSLTIHISAFDVSPGHGMSENVRRRQSSDRVADRRIARL